MTIEQQITIRMLLQRMIAMDHLHHWDERYHKDDRYKDAYYHFQLLYKALADDVLWYLDGGLKSNFPTPLEDIEELYANIVGKKLARERVKDAVTTSLVK